MSNDLVSTFIAGGLAGAAATVITCPLEVLKTRLQSTVGQAVVQEFRVVSGQLSLLPVGAGAATTTHHVHGMSQCAHQKISYFRHMLRTEGTRALFKGVTPTLVGSVPTRALYFCAYSQFKNFYNGILTPNTSQVHMCSAVCAGLLTSTLTSPIWVVKTQMQLHNKPGHLLKARTSAYKIWQMDGIRGFYRGLSASYAGVTETAIHFVLYEKLKKWMSEQSSDQQLKPWHYMLAASSARMSASCLCYPHEVCRTRLRQPVRPDQRRYHSFVQTLMKVWREEGAAGLYGGMSAHLIRVVPYHTIMFCSYETVVRLISYYRDMMEGV